MPDRKPGEDLALTYCPGCGLEFESEELLEARRAIRALAKLRDEQAELLRSLMPNYEGPPHAH